MLPHPALYPTEYLPLLLAVDGLVEEADFTLALELFQDESVLYTLELNSGLFSALLTATEAKYY